MAAIVVDLGNSRLKWGRLDSTGNLAETVALPLDDIAAWLALWDRWQGVAGPRADWAISSVNPPVAERLKSFLSDIAQREIRWVTSAADVPLAHALDHPERTGSDRALGVLAALSLSPPKLPGLVISCGSAIVVERIDAEGVWQGGAIAPGLGLSARALHVLTAQLPLVDVRQSPPVWGNATEPAIASGVFWGTVGAARELLRRMAESLPGSPWKIWTGGDAPLVMSHVELGPARYVADLVLMGLARLAFPKQTGDPRP